MDYDIEKELILSKIDYVIGGLEGLNKKLNHQTLTDAIAELIKIEKDIKEY